MSISPRGVAISGSMLIPLALMSVGFTLLFLYMVMVRTQMLYLEELREAKKGRLLSQAYM